MEKIKHKNNIDEIKSKINNNYYGANSLDDINQLKGITLDNDTGKDISQETNNNILYDDIDSIVENEVNGLSHILTPLNLDNEGNLKEKVKQIKKQDINLIFKVLTDILKHKYSSLEIYSGASEYFSVDSSTFFKKLNTKYRQDLLIELEGQTNFLKKKGITNLY